MPFPLKDDFRPGPLAQLTADWLNTVARILNHLSADGCGLRKTPVPTAANPWEIIVPAAPAPTPLSDDDPQAVGAAAAPGAAAEASRADHVHEGCPLNPANPGDCADLGAASEGSADAADSGTWTSGGAGGIDFYVITRVRLNNAVSNSNLYAYARLVRITPDGRIYSIGAETQITISTTVTGT